MRVLDDGRVYWSLGSIVEVNVHDERHDPNLYRAVCLTGGTWPTIKVLSDKYPEPLVGRPQNCPYTIWKELAESAEAEEEAIAAEERRVDEVREEKGMLVIVGQRKGHVRVVRKENDETVKEGLESIEAAAKWIEAHECDGCGRLITDPAEGCKSRHIGAPKEFSF